MIEKKHIIKSIGVSAGELFFIPLLCSYVVAVILLMIFHDDPKGISMAFMFGILLAIPIFIVFFIVYGLIVSGPRKFSDMRDAEKIFVDFIGSKPIYIDSDTVKDKLTAIAYDGKAIYVVDNGIACKIPWSEIRGWKYHIEGYVTVTSGSLLVGEIDNAAAKVEAKLNSGFYVQVSDVNNPEWHFTCTNEKVLKKWNEIFTQISEGKLQIA